MKSVFYNKKTIGVLAISLIITNFFTYIYINKKNNQENEQSVSSSVGSTCTYDVKRLEGYNYIKPLLFVDNKCESSNLNPLKESITALINNYKNLGVLNSASVYIKEYSANEWIGINSDEKFMPGSLLKVPQLITFLRMEEANPGTLNKVLVYNQNFILDKHPKIITKSIQLGQKYTIRQLLEYMIVSSDNNATSLLFANMDLNMFKKVFTDIGLAEPDLKSSNYPISAKDYSYFMRELYNASYLNIKNSEYATELLGKCDYKDGIISSLPNSIKVAHKFGEAGSMNEPQLSESAIIYLNSNPYIITIMTNGKDAQKLPEVIKQISGMVYQNMLNYAKVTS